MTISEEIKTILTNQSTAGQLKIKDFTEHFGARSSAFIIILLTLPIALPFTPPGLNTPFALVCVFLAFDIIFHREHSNVPKWLENRTLPFSPDGKFFAAMTKMLEWIEKIIRPRLEWVTTSKLVRTFLGIGILCASIVMIIPMSGINSISSLLVLLVAVGIVTKDGFVALAAAVCSVVLLIATIALIAALFYYGINFVNFDIVGAVKDFILR